MSPVGCHKVFHFRYARVDVGVDLYRGTSKGKKDA